MKSALRLFVSKHYWINQFRWKTFFRTLFTVVGVIVSAGVATEKLVGLVSSPNWLEQFFEDHYWFTTLGILGIALLVGIGVTWPKTRVSARLRQRDLTIAIEVGDLFDTSDTLVIGTNCTFDTELADGLISEKSLQGVFTKNFYDSPIHLDTDIVNGLQGITPTTLTRAEKGVGKLMSYPMGTVVRVRPRNREVYLLAMARMNGHGVAGTTLDEVHLSLANLWQYISERGGGMPNLRVPILGTGFGKLTTSRQEMVKEILRNFVPAAVSGRFCNQFTVVISTKDFIEHQIDINELGDFVRYLGLFTDIRNPADMGAGTGIGTA